MSLSKGLSRSWFDKLTTNGFLYFETFEQLLSRNFAGIRLLSGIYAAVRFSPYNGVKLIGSQMSGWNQKYSNYINIIEQ